MEGRRHRALPADRITREGPFGLGQLAEKLEISDHPRDHRAEIGVLVLAQEVFQVQQVVIVAGLDAGAKATEIQPGTAAVPEFGTSGQGQNERTGSGFVICV